MNFSLLVKASAGIAVVGGVASIPLITSSSSKSYKNLEERISLYLSSNFSICNELDSYVPPNQNKKNHKLYLCPNVANNSYKPELIYHLEDRTNGVSNKSTKKATSLQQKIENTLQTKLLIKLVDGETVILDKLPTWIQYTGSSVANNPELFPDKDCVLKKIDDASNNHYLFRCENSWKVTNEKVTLNIPY